MNPAIGHCQGYEVNSHGINTLTARRDDTNDASFTDMSISDDC